jgi:hypothetical protein
MFTGKSNEQTSKMLYLPFRINVWRLFHTKMEIFRLIYNRSKIETREGGGACSGEDILDTITIIVKLNTFTFIKFSSYTLSLKISPLTANLNTSEHTLRKVWRYHRGDQKPLIKKGQTIQISPKFNKISRTALIIYGHTLAILRYWWKCYLCFSQAIVKINISHEMRI